MLFQTRERLLSLSQWLRLRVEGRGYRRNVLDVAAQRFLFVPDGVEAAIDAACESPELLLCEPPFFSSKFRWID